MTVVPGAGAGAALVPATWLLEHLHDDDVVVLDASITRGEDAEGRTVFSDGEQTYLAGHVPGAVFADLFTVWSDPDGTYGFTRPTAEQVTAAARAAGIGPGSTVVVYDQLSGAYAARIWLVLRSWGFARVRLLDGGYAAWLGAGGEVETGAGRPVEAGPGFTAVDAGTFTHLDEVRRCALEAPGDDVRLVCALRRPEYEGETGRARSGHIPGSVNLPYPELLAADGTVDPVRVRELAADLGLDTGAVVAYCGGGVNAAGLALAFVEAGLEMPRVYDGSLNEWRAHDELPMEVGP